VPFIGQLIKSSQFLAKKLKLKVNRQKSAVARPQERKFLGFSFTTTRRLKIKISDKALQSAKRRIRQITRRSRGVSLEQMLKELNVYLRPGVARLLPTG